MFKHICFIIAMFLFVYVAGTVFFMFKEIYLNGEFVVYHPITSRIPILMELGASGAILAIAIGLFIKSLRNMR